jgi:PqqA peptide cyclase
MHNFYYPHMHAILQRLLSWKNGFSANPYSIELSPTLRCNLDCLFCWRHSAKIDFGRELSPATYKRIIKEAKVLGAEEIKIIGGGEASLRKDIIQLMGSIKKDGMRGYLCTNGTWFAAKDTKQIANMGWDHIKISLHGTEDIHDFLTQKKGSFRKAVKNILLLTKYKHTHRTKRPFVEIGMVLVNKNYQELPDVLNLAKKLGVDALFLEPITAYSKTGEKLRLNRLQTDETKTIVNKLRAHNIKNNFSSFSKLIDKTGAMHTIISAHKNDFLQLPCYEPFYRIGIRTDGIACPCGFYDESSRENIRDKNLNDIWFGDYFNSRRKSMLNNQLPDYCRKCCTTLVSNNIEIKKLLRNAALS